MAKRMNRGRSSESGARSRRSRGRQVRYCAVAALPGMRFRARPGTDAQFSCTRHETTEMMTISRGSCGDAEAPKQTAAHVFPPTPIVPTMSVARWACPAPSASHARVSAFPSPGLVRRSAARPAAYRRAGDGHPSWPANANGQDWTAADDSWPANGNRQDWTAGDDSWPANGNGTGQDWPYGEDHPSYPANGNGQNWTAGDDSWPVNGPA